MTPYIVSIDLTNADTRTAVALASYVHSIGLTLDSSPVDGPEIVITPAPKAFAKRAAAAESAPVASAPKRKAKAPKVTKAAGRVKAKPAAPKSAATLTAADVLAMVKKNPGQRSEVYTAGQSTENREAVKRGLAKLRKEGLVASVGAKRATVWTPVPAATVEHKGQKLQKSEANKVGRVDTGRVKPPTVRDAVTKIERPMNAGAEE
jgi:hypothetical protein